MRTGDSPGPLPYPPSWQVPQVAQVAEQEPTASHLGRTRSPPLPPMCCLPLSLSSESLHLCISSTVLQLRATAKGRTGPMGVARVLISKVFAMPSCFASNTQPRNKKNREKEREISVIKNQMIFPLHYPIPRLATPFPHPAAALNDDRKYLH